MTTHALLPLLLGPFVPLAFPWNIAAKLKSGLFPELQLTGPLSVVLVKPFRWISLHLGSNTACQGLAATGAAISCAGAVCLRRRTG